MEIFANQSVNPQTFFNALDKCNDAILVTTKSSVNNKWSIAYINNIFCESLEYSVDELIGKNPIMLYHESQIDYLRKSIKNSNGDISELETKCKTKKGNIIDITFSITPIEFDLNNNPTVSIAIIRKKSRTLAMTEMIDALSKDADIDNILISIASIALKYTNGCYSYIKIFNKRKHIYEIKAAVKKIAEGILQINKEQFYSNFENDNSLSLDSNSFLGNDPIILDISPDSNCEMKTIFPETKSVLRMPLFSWNSKKRNKNTIGTITILSDDKNAFSCSELNIVENISEQFSEVYNNIRKRILYDAIIKLNEKCRQSLSLKETIDAYLDSSIELLSADGGAIVIIDNDKFLTSYTIRNMPINGMNGISEFQYIQNYINRCKVIKEGIHAKSEDMENLDCYYHSDVLHGYKSFIASPIFYKKNDINNSLVLLGAIYLCWKNKSAFDEIDELVLNDFANMAASPIKKAQYFLSSSRLNLLLPSISKDCTNFSHIINLIKKEFDASGISLYLTKDTKELLSNIVPEVYIYTDIMTDMNLEYCNIDKDFTEFPVKQVTSPEINFDNLDIIDSNQFGQDGFPSIYIQLKKSGNLLGSIHLIRKRGLPFFTAFDRQDLKTVTNFFNTYLELFRTENFFKFVISNSPNSIMITRRIKVDNKNSWIVTMINRSGMNLFGFENPHEILGSDIKKCYTNETIEKILATKLNPRTNPKISIEVDILRTDGKKIPVALSLSVLPGGYTIGICRDISKEKEMQNQIIKQERLSSINQVGLGFVHDSRDTFMVISGYLETIIDYIPKNLRDTPATKNLIDDLLGHSALLRKYFTLLPKLTNISNMPKKMNDLFEIFNDVHDLMQVKIDKYKKIIFVSAFKDQDFPKIYCEEIQMMRIFINLMLNSIYSLATSSIPNKKIVVNFKRLNEKWIQVIFEDNGPGIEDDKIDCIWERGYTTRPKGSGIGLTTTKIIIEEEYHGTIRVKSLFGSFCRFIIDLPIDDLNRK